MKKIHLQGLLKRDVISSKHHICWGSIEMPGEQMRCLRRWELAEVQTDWCFLKMDSIINRKKQPKGNKYDLYFIV